MRSLTIPISDEEIRSLHMGDSVTISGVMLTARDAVHKWLIETFINKTRPPQNDDEAIYEKIHTLLNGGIIYHCGPVVAGVATKQYRFVAAGPTTSTRTDPMQGDVMRHFNVKAVIGKGGMGAKTLAACQEVPGVYMHAVGGAAAVFARAVVNVPAVYKLEFGVPEAIWIMEVKEFPAVVTMDAHGRSLHADVEASSKQALQKLLAPA
jgi:tartrate/fumarate subfamily iron-sulfur-dependent hydro-lyase beta chain